MSYFNILQILTFENIYKFKLALFIHKIKNHPTNIPAIFSGTLTLVSEVHNYNTRFATNFNSNLICNKILDRDWFSARLFVT